MNLDNLPSLSETISQYELAAKKNLGQNFLLDPNITNRIAKSAGDLSQSTVIEIGPGPGGLTRSLLYTGAKHVIAIERDDRCIEALQELTQASDGKLEVVAEDALKVRPQDLAKGPIKIVANLPYNIATELLINWIKDLENIQSMTLMFQKEVALRITADPGSKAYGRLSILSQWLCEAQRLFDLPPGAFSPPPKVTSSIVHLKPKQVPAEKLKLLPTLEALTQKAFSQRRKMLRSSLKGVVTENTLEKLGIPPTARAEELTVEQFIELAKTL